MLSHMLSDMLTKVPPASQEYPEEVHGTKAAAVQSTALAFWPSLDRPLWAYGLCSLSCMDHWNGFL